MVVLGKEQCGAGMGPSGSVRLRVIGLFAILAGSAVLTFLPVLVRGRYGALLVLGTAFSSGVVLATAFVHILPDADAAMTSPCLGITVDFPWASTIAGASVMFLLTLENVLRTLLRKRLGTGTPQSTVQVHDSVGINLEANITSNVKSASECESEKEAKTNLTLAAIFLESGIVFHSVFVGINYGVTADDSTSTALMIALIFHQAFDGLALGSAFVAAKFSVAKYLIFSVIFILVTPLGVAMGLGISTSYDPSSKAALGSEAAFNSVSAGLLIYNALANLIVPLFNEDTSKISLPLNLGKYVALYAGYVCMAIVGKWA